MPFSNKNELENIPNGEAKAKIIRRIRVHFLKREFAQNCSKCKKLLDLLCMTMPIKTDLLPWTWQLIRTSDQIVVRK